MKFSIRNFFSKCDQIGRKLRIWSHLLKKLLTENFIFCAVYRIYLSILLSPNSAENYKKIIAIKEETKRT